MLHVSEKKTAVKLRILSPNVSFEDILLDPIDVHEFLCWKTVIFHVS